MIAKRPVFRYGVGLDASGKLVQFLVRGAGKTPAEIVSVLEERTTDAVINEAERMRNLLRQKWHRRSVELVEAEASWLAESAVLDEVARRRAYETGRVAVHVDRQGAHVAVILDPAEDALALFLTLHPGWARKARPLTEDERALVSPRCDPETHFAPVVRPRTQFSLRHGQLPAWRVEALLQEFPREVAS